MSLSFTVYETPESVARELARSEEADGIVEFLAALAEALDVDARSELVDEVRAAHKPDRLAILGLCQALADAAREGGTD